MEVDFGGGAGGECWQNKHGYPVLVSYYGKDTRYFSLQSLERALALSSEKFI
jgi:hypothetical protein